MTPDDFRGVIRLVQERWPKMPFTKTIQDDWWAYLNRYPAPDVRSALRHLYATSRFHPRIAEVEAAIKNVRSGAPADEQEVRVKRQPVWPPDTEVLDELQMRPAEMVEQERSTGLLQLGELRRHPGNRDADPQRWCQGMRRWIWLRCRHRLGVQVPMEDVDVPARPTGDGGLMSLREFAATDPDGLFATLLDGRLGRPRSGTLGESIFPPEGPPA